ncbi:MAG: hypothetical protein QOJ06_1473 [Pseudonocardiales bacterium]|nr:hypothetical protein [Pseudonocardiales bacterium]
MVSRRPSVDHHVRGDQRRERCVPRPTAEPEPGVPGLSQQGHRTGLKDRWPTAGNPRDTSCRAYTAQQRPTWGAANVAVLDRRHGNPRGLIRDVVGVGFALLMALVFAPTAGVHVGAAYIDQMLAR